MTEEDLFHVVDWSSVALRRRWKRREVALVGAADR